MPIESNSDHEKRCVVDAKVLADRLAKSIPFSSSIVVSQAEHDYSIAMIGQIAADRFKVCMSEPPRQNKAPIR